MTCLRCGCKMRLAWCQLPNFGPLCLGCACKEADHNNQLKRVRVMYWRGRRKATCKPSLARHEDYDEIGGEG